MFEKRTQQHSCVPISYRKSLHPLPTAYIQIDHQRFLTPLPKSRVVVVVFEMLINYSELQVFVCWSCLRSAYCANAPKFISWFLCCHICFKVWACLIVHYCSLLHANLYTNIPFGNYFPNQMQSCLATIGELTDIKRQFRSSITALDFFSQRRRSWPNLGLE